MIVSNNIGGLANRMKSIASGYRIANHTNIKLMIKWDILDNYNTQTHILNCPFSKLFQNRNVIDNIPDINNIGLYNSHCLAIFDSDTISQNFNTFSSNCKKQFTKSDKLNRNIDFMYNEIPDKIKKEYIDYFQKLQPTYYILNEIGNFSKKFNDKTVSVHIRSWNRNGEAGRREDLFNITKWEDKMDNFSNDYQFYLSSDSKEVINYFIKNEKYKDRILIYDRQTNLDKSRDFPEGIVEDLIELYLLSKNKIIIGSHFSTFTEVAWYLGGCSDDITIV